MMVLKLWEQGRLSLDDSLQKFFPAFPIHGINLRMLLSHRSGLPNYVYLMDTMYRRLKRYATNDDVLTFFAERKPRMALRTNARYEYCNTNFALLASVVEKVTGQPFPRYMHDSLFVPLGMKHTFVFSVADTGRYKPSFMNSRRLFPLDVMDCTYGDKNVYSTVRDLLLWDKALYENRFVKQATFDTAVVPRSNEKKTMHNYGYGWHLFMDKTDTIVFHNGWWHGNNNAFVRLVEDTATVIVLSNTFNRRVYQAKKFAVAFRHYKNDESALGEGNEE
jgi:CubicO group peptidase (beta-lactamase class C family)